jgi:ankyrin repeat protein
VVEGDGLVRERRQVARVDFDKGNNDGCTPLIWKAAAEGRFEILRLLIKKGADANAVDGSHGRTALSWGSRNGHLKVVQELLKAGADVEKGSNKGSTPLIFAAENGHLDIVEELLLAGVDFDKGNNDGYTPLIWAAAKGRLEVSRLLIEKGADLSKRATGGHFSGKSASDIVEENPALLDLRVLFREV